MNVLVLSSVYPRFHEDSEVPWLRTSIKKLRESGCDIRVIAPSHKGLKSHEIDGVKIYRFRYATKNLEILTHDEGAPSKMAKNPFLQLLAIPYIISGAIKTLSLAMKSKPDIIHVHWPFPHAFMAHFAKLFVKTKIVLNFHGAELLLAKKKKWIRPILKFFIKRANAIVTNSAFTASQVTAIHNRRVNILPYGTTLGAKENLSAHNDTQSETPREKFRILFVGRHIERKGIEYLIRAAAMLDAEKFQVRIAGAGNLTEELKTLAQKEAPDQVLFLGKLSNEDLEKEYESAGCFVLPAIIDSRGDTEGLGVVLIEAAEYLVPIIASGVGGIVDVIIDNETGILVKEKSPQELADAIIRLSSDDKLCKRLSQNCKAHVNAFFSWDRITQKQLELYASVK